LVCPKFALHITIKFRTAILSNLLNSFMYYLVIFFLSKRVCVEMGQDRIDFEKFRWFLVVPILSLLLKCITLRIDSNRSIEITEPKIGVAKIKFFDKYDRSVGFCIIPISMKSANTTYISSLLVTGFQSSILKRNGKKLLACIFCVA